MIGSLLAHAAPPVRSLAFSVLVSSLSSIRPFTTTTFNLLQSHMGALYAETDAKFRNEVLTNTKHMVERLRGASSYLMREIQIYSYSRGPGPSPKIESQEQLTMSELLNRHKSFVIWYLKFLLDELIPTSSYQRHITALKSITLVLKSGILERDLHLSKTESIEHGTVWPYTINFFTSGSLRLLLDLLMDPFEDVRGHAAAILKFASPSDFSTFEYKEYVGDLRLKPNLQDAESLEQVPGLAMAKKVYQTVPKSMILLTEFIARATEDSKRTGRADFADGVARCYELLFNHLPTTGERLNLVGSIIDDLSVKVSLAEQDLSKAVAKAPIHSDFATLR
jgi:hypothetical protein